MKLLLFAIACVAAVYAEVNHLPSNEYLPGNPDISPVEAPASNFILDVPPPSPVQAEAPAPAHVLADDGYRYKTHRRVVYRRNRRDVSHLPSNDYLPPVQETHVSAPANDYLPPVQKPAPVTHVLPAPVEASPAHVLADDGYRYKTHRRVVYRRNRRDVSHLPSNDYLPPVQETHVSAPANDYLPPVQQPAPVAHVLPAPVEASPAHVLAEDGYRYKTHRRVVYRRNRRDVSHFPTNDYLPPAQETHVSAPANDYLPPVQQPALVAHVLPAPVEASPAHVLADDGYRYKTHRRVVYRRNRRDISHLPTNDYLPPAQETHVSAPANDYLPPVQQPAPVAHVLPAPVEASPAHVLADDGYRYKTHRRVVYRRNRRDVSHLPSNDYLPPVQETHVSAPANDYLPPVQQPAPVAHVLPAPVEASPAHVLAEDGYRYKTHRRVVYRRNRRDVSHLPSNDYLPPVQETHVSAPANDYLPPVQQPAPVAHVLPAPVEASPAHVLADDGYRYKTHRRVVYRRNRRDVSHLPSNDYLPPVQETHVSAPANDYLPPVQPPALVAHVLPAPVEAFPAHVLADDGYRYKTHRRVVYRRNRRDISHLPTNDYLPPAQETHVSAPANDYLPPVQQPAPVAHVLPAPVEASPAHVLADDGYRYKTHRRVVYRRQ